MTEPAHVLETLSVNAFAAHIGVDEKAVRKGIRNGRLERSIGQDANGRSVIVDLALAEREWQENQQSEMVRGGARNTTIARERQKLIQAQRRKVNLHIRERLRDLIPRRAMEIRFSTRVVTARTKLLGIPSRAKQRIPHLTTADLAELEALIREALDELAEDRE